MHAMVMRQSTRTDGSMPTVIQVADTAGTSHQTRSGVNARIARAIDPSNDAPSSPTLEVFKAVGKLFPRGDRSPSIVPVAEKKLRRLLGTEPQLQGWKTARTERVSSGFYTSQALELVRASSAS